MNMVWLFEPFRHEFMQRALFGCALIGFTNGALSSFIVIRRLALMADAMAHSLLHFSTPFTNNNRNSEQNTAEEYH